MTTSLAHCVGLTGALVLAIAPASALAQQPCQEAKLLASDPDDGDRFGQAVALSGDRALIGAFRHDDVGINSGAAYVYRLSGASWVFEQELLASDGASSDRFGWAVAIDGDRALIGARTDDDGGLDAGSAYVFRRSGTVWTQEQKLTAFDGAAGDELGTSVALQGNVAVVGANFDDDGGASSGSAYVFRRDGTSWTFEAKLTASDAAAGDDFGVSVAIDGEWIFVGAQLENQGGSVAGATYVFQGTHGAWGQFAKLLSSDISANDRFGYAVDVSGTRALIGAFGDDPSGSTSGSAYVFHFTGLSWVQEQKLTASDGALADAFGWSVAIDGDVALVAARLEDAGGMDSGAAYVYRRDPASGVWGGEAKFIGNDTAANDSFAYDVDLDGDRVLAGAWADDDGFDEAGSAYLFLGAQGVDCDGNGQADSCELFAGTASDTDGDGLLDVCEPGTPFCFGTLADCPCANAGAPGAGCDNAAATGGVRLDALGDPAQNDVVLLGSGFPPAAAPSVVAIRSPSPESPPVVFGDGLRCIGVAGLVRFGASAASGGLSSHPVNHGAGPGSFRYQLWYRSTPAVFCDPAAAFNLSNGLTIVWP